MTMMSMSMNTEQGLLPQGPHTFITHRQRLPPSSHLYYRYKYNFNYNCKYKYKWKYIYSSIYAHALLQVHSRNPVWIFHSPQCHSVTINHERVVPCSAVHTWCCVRDGIGYIRAG